MRKLTAEEMRNVIEGKGKAYRVPMVYHIWIEQPQIFGENEATAKALLDKYPCDVDRVLLNMPEIYTAPSDAPEYRYIHRNKAKSEKTVGIDSEIAIEDWSELDDVLRQFPDPEYKNLIPKSAGEKDGYRLIHWWYWLFERLWSLRGMENALTDFYLYPEKVHKLFSKLTDFYCRAIERGKEELSADGVFISDDIGTQTGPFFSLDIFREFFKPYYKRLIDKAHELKMHVWLHTCGNIELYLPDLIEIGLDVLHPIQKYAMDEVEIARKYGGKITFLAGFDVQRTIPYGTKEDVENEVKHLIDTYSRDDGRFILTLGNAATPDCPIESLEALLKTSYEYGLNKSVEC